MKCPTRIYYTDTDKAFMWDRCFAKQKEGIAANLTTY
jgi:hypothetical protein